jgi:hypothetical protein
MHAPTAVHVKARLHSLPCTLLTQSRSAVRAHRQSRLGEPRYTVTLWLVALLTHMGPRWEEENKVYSRLSVWQVRVFVCVFVCVRVCVCGSCARARLCE